jgi:hypothetical protein
MVKQLVSLAKVNRERSWRQSDFPCRLTSGRVSVPPGFVVATTKDDLEVFETDILQAFNRLDVRLRSSTLQRTQEDGHEAAWAGQLDTFLNVPCIFGTAMPLRY